MRNFGRRRAVKHEESQLLRGEMVEVQATSEQHGPRSPLGTWADLTAVVWRTACWLILDQRKLIRQGFGDGSSFALDLFLPVYSGKQIGRRITTRRRRVVFFRDPDVFLEAFRLPPELLDGGSAYSFLKPYFGDESVFVMEGAGHVPAKQAIYRVIRENMAVQADDLLFFQYSIREIFKEGIYPVLPALQYVSAAFVLRTIFGEQGTPLADRIIREATGAAGNASGTFLLLPQLIRWTRRVGTGLAIRRQRIALRSFIADTLDGLDVGDRWTLPAGEKQLVDNLMTLLIAGFETTATTVAWLLYELALHPVIQAELRSEIVGAMARDPVHYLEDDDTLLARCVQETLRLHPSIPFVIREVKGVAEIGGRRLAAGDYIILSIEEMQARHYGKDGLSFDPERMRGRQSHPKIATFGGGAKICPGRAIAVQQVRALTLLLISGFLIEEVPGKTDGRVIRNRVSANPRGGMVLSLKRLV